MEFSRCVEGTLLQIQVPFLYRVLFYFEPNRHPVTMACFTFSLILRLSLAEVVFFVYSILVTEN